MEAVPRHLLILGGGPVGAEMAQAVRRLGGEVTLVEAASHVLAREPVPLGEALGEELRRDGIELILGIQATAARRDGSGLRDDPRRTAGKCAATGCSRPPDAARGCLPGWRRWVSPRAGAASRSTRT